MLAQNFKTATQLDLTEAQRSALIKTLVLFETDKLTHAPTDGRGTSTYREDGPFTGHFNMGRWRAVQECGTVCCIAGTAELVGSVEFPYHACGALGDLFWVNSIASRNIQKITPSQAATALRSYLTTGDARWDLAVA